MRLALSSSLPIGMTYDHILLCIWQMVDILLYVIICICLQFSRFRYRKFLHVFVIVQVYKKHLVLITLLFRHVYVHHVLFCKSRTLFWESIYSNVIVKSQGLGNYKKVNDVFFFLSQRNFNIYIGQKECTLYCQEIVIIS